MTSESQMQAAFYARQGPAREVLQVGEQPIPEPGPGEVRVHLKTSGVNPSDWKSRSGRTAPMSAPLIIPHSDGAGDIDRVGPDVANRVGERVWVWNGQWRRPRGTAAEYIVLPSAQAVLMPEHIGYAEGACFGIPALTALQAVRLAELSPASTVMIVGGAGSVARYAIQFAKMRGARVVTTVSGPGKAAHALRAGADEVINYRTENVGSARQDLDQWTRGRCNNRARSLHERQRLAKHTAAARNRRRLRHVVKRIDVADAVANAQLDHASAVSCLRPQYCRSRCLPCRAERAPPKQPADPHGGSTLAVA